VLALAPAATLANWKQLPTPDGGVPSVAGLTGAIDAAALKSALALAATDISGLAASATTDTTNAGNIASGTLPNARLSAVPNSALANAGVTISGHSLALGGSLSLAVADISGLGALATLGVGSGLTSSGGNLSANVTNVAGRTGAIALSQADISGLTTSDSPAFAGLSLTGNGALASGKQLSFGSSSTYISNTSSHMTFVNGASGYGFAFYAVGGDLNINTYSGAGIGFSTGTGGAYNTVDISLKRDAAGQLGQRVGTAAQSYSVYNSYTSATNYSKFSLDAGLTSSGVNRIMSAVGSSGTKLPIAIDAYAMSGAPTATQLPAGTAGIFKDSSGGGVVVAYNDGGTIKSAALS
jgi:hypothetical protein